MFRAITIRYSPFFMELETLNEYHPPDFIVPY